MAADTQPRRFERSSTLFGLTWEHHYRPVLRYIGLAVMLVWLLLPAYFTFVNSLKTPSEIFAAPLGIPFVTFQPEPLAGKSAWTNMWEVFPFFEYMLATFIASMGTAMLATVAGVFAAYSFARLDFPWKTKLFVLTVSGFMVPHVLLAIPIFVLMVQMSLLNTYIGLILAFTAFTLPYNIWLLRGFFEDLPENLEESARIDGCTHFGAFRRVILPISRPAIASVFLLAFLLAWHNYVMAYIISQDPLHATLSVGLIRLQGRFYVQNFHFINAGIFITMIVPVLLYMYLQKYLVEGLSASSGLKG